MKVIDLHPEDLFDKEDEGTLSDEERTRLDAHLRACAACRFERAVHRDLAREFDAADALPDMHLLVSGALKATPPQPLRDQAPPARPLDPSALEETSLAGSALSSRDSLQSPPAEPPAPPPALVAARPSASRWLRRPALMMAAALALVTGAAAAQSGVAGRVLTFSLHEISAAIGLTTAPPPAVTVAPRAHAAQPHATTEPAPVVSSVSIILVAPMLSASAETAAPEAPASARPGMSGTSTQNGAQPTGPSNGTSNGTSNGGSSNGGSSTGGASNGSSNGSSNGTTASGPSIQTGAAPSGPSIQTGATASGSSIQTGTAATATATAEPAASAAPAADTASSLFERASAARRQGRAGEAAALYQELQARFPRSSEAQLAVVLMARAHLDQGNAAAALAGFDAYLRGGGALREEAMAGRALALGRLGRTAEEQQAWSALLAAFPRTSYAALAEKRLGRAPR